VSAAFGQDLRLLGYDIGQKAEALHLTLYWRAERRMDVDYRIAAYLFDLDSGELVSQVDVMPRDWTYPTCWWEIREVVADEMVLPVTEVPAGRYQVAVGVYHPQTGKRLSVGDAEGEVESLDLLILQEVTLL
jgi:hypothetical protein